MGPAPPVPCRCRGSALLVRSQSVPSHWLLQPCFLRSPLQCRNLGFSLTLSPVHSGHFTPPPLASRPLGTRTCTLSPTSFTTLHSSLATVLSLCEPSGSLSRPSSLPIRQPGPSFWVFCSVLGKEKARRCSGTRGRQPGKWSKEGVAGLPGLTLTLRPPKRTLSFVFPPVGSVLCLSWVG